MTTSRTDLIRASIDGTEIEVAPGTLIIRAAEQLGIQIPRFCDHPLLEPVGACRQCIVDVEGQRKPLASCTTPVADGMVIHTQESSEVARDAQRGVMELLLINHPLDCPVCDKGGECPLQNQAMSAGRTESRFTGVKRTFPKPIPLSSEVLLDRERCVLCARCTRFADEVAGDPYIDLLERGAHQQVGIAPGQPFDSYFSGNTVQICPVGALTGSAYRFRARPFDLVSTPSACEHCASGCTQRTDHRRGQVLRRLAGDNPAVNAEWNCDKGRWAFTYATAEDRLRQPMIRSDGRLEPVSWMQALTEAARGLDDVGSSAVLTGGRGTVEDAYGYAKFARMVLGTNDIDFRSRAISAEETEFLAARVAGTPLTTSYADLTAATAVLFVGFEPEEESPIIFLRLRAAVRRGNIRVASIAPWASPGLTKLSGTLLATAPGAEPAALGGLDTGSEFGAALAAGGIIVAGERLATVPGGYTAVAALADRLGTRLVWVPRRAGDRGAVEAGALPNLLPGGRPITDSLAREQITSAWRIPALPLAPGRDTAGIIAAAAAGDIDALLVGGVDPGDLPDPRAALAGLRATRCLVSLEQRPSSVTDHAQVVLPVATVAEKSGTFVNWEGRRAGFEAALDAGELMSDHRVLGALARRMGVDTGLDSAAAIRTELDSLGVWTGDRPAPQPVSAPIRTAPGPGRAVLCGWQLLLDAGRLQDGEPHLAGTAHPVLARISARTAADIAVTDGGLIAVRTDRGHITLPVAITEMPDAVVWLPLNSPTSAVYRQLGPAVGTAVRIEAVPTEPGGGDR